MALKCSRWEYSFPCLSALCAQFYDLFFLLAFLQIKSVLFQTFLHGLQLSTRNSRSPSRCPLTSDLAEISEPMSADLQDSAGHTVKGLSKAHHIP